MLCTEVVVKTIELKEPLWKLALIIIFGDSDFSRTGAANCNAINSRNNGFLQKFCFIEGRSKSEVRMDIP